MRVMQVMFGKAALTRETLLTFPKPLVHLFATKLILGSRRALGERWHAYIDLRLVL